MTDAARFELVMIRLVSDQQAVELLQDTALQMAVIARSAQPHGNRWFVTIRARRDGTW